MKLTIMQWLIHGIPECIAVVFLGLALVERRLNIRKALLPGLIQAIVLYLIRLLPWPFGIHTLIAVLSLSILLLFFAGGPYSKALIVSIFVYLILGLFELTFLPLASYFLKIPLEKIYDYLVDNLLLYILSGLPQVVLMILLAVIINLFYEAKKKRKGSQQ